MVERLQGVAVEDLLKDYSIDACASAVNWQCGIIGLL
jgi:hypothetical protein